MGNQTNPLRVVAVGQTPPPFYGQALGIQSFVAGQYNHIEIFHVRMAFSREISDVGKLRVRKPLHLLELVIKVLRARLRSGSTTLYYPPAGPDLVPVLRDICVLLATRWAFSSTVFHFRAAGLSEIWPRLPRLLRPFFRVAYRRPDLAIQTSALNPPDGRFLGARRTVVVPNGVPELPVSRSSHIKQLPEPPVLLYVGALRESKGLMVLVDACRRLRVRGLDFRLHLVGSFESSAFDVKLRQALRDSQLDVVTSFWGTLTGTAKAACYQQSTIFCFPTYYRAESFGLVVAEAMQFSLPVVATRWRGVPSVVEDGGSGLLVPVRDPNALADALQTLLENPHHARRMGRRGREIYLDRFTEERFRENMEWALRSMQSASE